jgi:hypothetical protein
VALGRAVTGTGDAGFTSGRARSSRRSTGGCEDFGSAGSSADLGGCGAPTIWAGGRSGRGASICVEDAVEDADEDAGEVAIESL